MKMASDSDFPFNAFIFHENDIQFLSFMTFAFKDSCQQDTVDFLDETCCNFVKVIR